MQRDSKTMLQRTAKVHFQNRETQNISKPRQPMSWGITANCSQVNSTQASQVVFDQSNSMGNPRPKWAKNTGNTNIYVDTDDKYTNGRREPRYGLHTTQLLLFTLGQCQESPSSGWSDVFKTDFPVLQQRSCSVILFWQEHYTQHSVGMQLRETSRNLDILNPPVWMASTFRS